ncbi:MAG: biotin carboxylase N-terminal domain-containing protein, partial [Gordonia sp. (in: high G+C Gram-positive bacteria)]
MTRIVVANRGEIAVRILRAVDDLGFEGVSVYADDDTAALHVMRADHSVALPGTGPAAYLDADAIIAAARAAGADAIHPGYGFLSENADFARAVADADLTFIGPPPSVLRALGNKATARTLAEAAGVPVP